MKDPTPQVGRQIQPNENDGANHNNNIVVELNHVVSPEPFDEVLRNLLEILIDETELDEAKK